MSHCTSMFISKLYLENKILISVKEIKHESVMVERVPPVAIYLPSLLSRPIHSTPRAKTPCRINRLIRAVTTRILSAMNFAWPSPLAEEISTPLPLSLSPLSFSPYRCSRSVSPRRPLHCSVGQSRPRLRRTCGIARGVRAFSPDRRDGPIRPNSHECSLPSTSEGVEREKGVRL